MWVGRLAPDVYRQGTYLQPQGSTKFHITTLTQAFIVNSPVGDPLSLLYRFFSNLWRREALNLCGIMNIQAVDKLGI
jgi:hypothetical protein